MTSTSRPLVAALGILLLATAGCRVHGRGPSSEPDDTGRFEPAAYQPLRDQPESRLRTRLEAADAIVYAETADTAFAKIALDAAASGCVDLAREALRKIVWSDMNDRVAYAAARHLYEAGLVEDSRSMAGAIVSTPLQDEALERIASGRPWNGGPAR